MNQKHIELICRAICKHQGKNPDAKVPDPTNDSDTYYVIPQWMVHIQLVESVLLILSIGSES